MSNLKKALPYILSPLFALAAFFVYFKAWNIDFTMPLFDRYDTDVLLHAFFSKTIIDNGWFLVNNFVGAPHINGQPFYLYDFPLEGSSFTFFVFKCLSYITNNPFEILNLNFIFTIGLVSLTSFIALRNFGISVFTSLLISTLYDLSFYHLYRSTYHALLTNYAAVPLVIMVSSWIMSGKIKMVQLNQKNQYHLEPNRLFFAAALIAIFVATTDVYYAIYSCIIFAMSWFLSGMIENKFFNKNLANIAAICLFTLITLFILYIPSLLFWVKEGANNEVTVRHYSQSEYFALRIVDLILPISNHFIEYLANIRNFFNFLVNYDIVLAHERESCSLGLIGSIGFIFLLFWPFAKTLSQDKLFKNTVKKFQLKEDDISLLSRMSLLNLLIVLFASVGGFVMLMVPLFSSLRAHDRFAVFISFISLLAISLIVDRFIENSKNQKLSKVIIFIIFILGLFDQIGKTDSEKFQDKSSKTRFISDQKFASTVDKSMAKNSKILILPISPFPEADDYSNSIGYLHSYNLIWSYPVINNRESFKWQKSLKDLNIEKLVLKAKEAGFVGIMINRKFLVDLLEREEQTKYKNGWEYLRHIEKYLGKNSKKKITSPDLKYVFYELSA